MTGSCTAWPSIAWTGITSVVRETLDLLNPATGQSELTGGPVSVSNFSNGIWVVFHFTGNVKLHVANTNANAECGHLGDCLR